MFAWIEMFKIQNKLKAAHKADANIYFSSESQVNYCKIFTKIISPILIFKNT